MAASSARRLRLGGPEVQARTYLFVPGNRPERFDKAAAAGADAIILDLEDAVAPQDKDRARINVRQWLDAHRDAADPR